tara:strand:+ start:152 stop:625 length:474 start_codon:yes stop_codon:yes gene_type:complete
MHKQFNPHEQSLRSIRSKRVRASGRIIVKVNKTVRAFIDSMGDNSIQLLEDVYGNFLNDWGDDNVSVNFDEDGYDVDAFQDDQNFGGMQDGWFPPNVPRNTQPTTYGGFWRWQRGTVDVEFTFTRIMDGTLSEMTERLENYAYERDYQLISVGHALV